MTKLANNIIVLASCLLQLLRFLLPHRIQQTPVSEIPIVDIDIIPQQKDNNHAKQIVEISPAFEHNLEIDVHHLSVPTVDRDDTENPLYATLSSSSLLH